MVSNGQIVRCCEENGLQEAAIWLRGKHISPTKATINGYRNKIKKILIDYNAIQKNYQRPGYEDLLKEFESESVEYPCAGKPRKRKADEVDLASNSSYVHTFENLKQISQDMGNELMKCKMENQSLKKEVVDLKAKVKSLQQSKFKLLDRKEKEVEKLQLRRESHMKYQIMRKGEMLKRQRLQTSYYSRRTYDLANQLSNLIEEQNTMRREEEKFALEHLSQLNKIKELEKDLKQYMTENEMLRDTVNGKLETFDETTRSYSPETQQCVYSLLEHNVSTTKIPLVMRDVLKLVNMEASHLPSSSTCSSMNLQRLNLVQQQLAEEFSSKKNTCLLSDETSKFGEKYEGFHASDDSGRIWVLGLRQMATKSGRNALDTFKEILDDINESNLESNNDISNQILMNISSTMSDRAATQIKFNELLEEFRKDAFKNNINFESMREDEQNSVSRLFNFFCSLHILVHVAEAAEKALIETEKLQFQNAPIYDASFCKAVESGTTRLIRSCSKAFSRGGDDKNGVHAPFVAYIQEFLKENGFQSMPLERFRGNRFNILFSNAAIVYFLSDKFTEFLEGGDTNRLLKATKFDLDVPEYIAGCRALGLVSELITKPFWSLIEKKEINILDMQEFYIELLDYMENIDTAKFMNGESLLSFVNSEKLANSKIFQSLIKSTQIDDKVVSVLEVIIPAVRNVIQKLLKEFLPGGQWFECEHSMKEKVVATPKHNKFSETVFGQLDRLLREKPNVSILTSEAIIAFCQNKTLSWILSKPPKEREELCVSARKSTKEMMLKFKARQKEIQVQVRRNIELKLKNEKEQQYKRIKKLENMVIDIQRWGLWQTHAEVESALSRIITRGEKLSALKSQLNFRKFVLKQTSTAANFAFSKKDGDKRKSLTVEELTESIKTLVVEALDVAEPSTECPLLIGAKVTHALPGNSEVWNIGQVVSQVPGYSDWYNIKYSGDETIYTHQLLHHYKIGLLKLMV